MSIKKQLSARNSDLHHAYLIEGEPEKAALEIISFLEERGVNCAGNPDVCREFFETMSIEASRALKELGANKSSGGGNKFFILGSHFFTREAENALLKTFEEPPAGTHFFLITPNPHLLTPALRSRMDFIRALDRSIDKKYLEEAEGFLKLPKARRIAAVESMVKKYKDGEEESSLRREALNLLDALEVVLYKSNENKIPWKGSFEEIRRSRGYMTDRGASIKMLLEHLALILPQMK